MARDEEILKMIEDGVGAKLHRVEELEKVLYGTPSYFLEDGKLLGLSFFGIRLRRLPPGLFQLQDVQTVDLGSTHLRCEDVSDLAALSSLQSLDLRSNQLTNLPESILDLKMSWGWKPFNIGGLNLFGNPLTSPPAEIFQKGREAVQAFFQSLTEEHSLNEARILFVGDGAVGKTSLVKRFLGEEFDSRESQTHGINIRRWQIDKGERQILARFWDFGGQEIMHATHQFFLSKRSLYVLVLDVRKDDKTEYWLRAIESFGGNSPTLVVLNKIDENPGFDVNRRHLLRKYSFLRGFYRVSCRDGTGIAECRRALEDTLSEVEVTSTLWPRSWFRVKQEFEEMSAPFIDYDQYIAFCQKSGVTERKIQETLVSFLRDLGIVVHFPDFELQNVYVLEPRWVTEGVYTILNAPELAAARGVLELRQLSRILKPHAKYPREKHRYLVDLMKKFELCYTLDAATVLVPDLLEVQEPEIPIDLSDSLRFRFDYLDFLPRSILPRFIVKMHPDIHGDLRWRSGVVLRSAAFGATAVVCRRSSPPPRPNGSMPIDLSA